MLECELPGMGEAKEVASLDGLLGKCWRYPETSCPEATGGLG